MENYRSMRWSHSFVSTYARWCGKWEHFSLWCVKLLHEVPEQNAIEAQPYPRNFKLSRIDVIFTNITLIPWNSLRNVCSRLIRTCLGHKKVLQIFSVHNASCFRLLIITCVFVSLSCFPFSLKFYQGIIYCRICRSCWITTKGTLFFCQLTTVHCPIIIKLLLIYFCRNNPPIKTLLTTIKEQRH